MDAAAVPMAAPPPGPWAGPLPPKAGVLEKRRHRHVAAIQAFEDHCRALSAQRDEEIEERLHALRMSIVLSHEDSEKLLAALEAQADRPDGGLVGDELQELTLGVLQEKD
eukprot:EG_transcript_52613